MVEALAKNDVVDFVDQHVRARDGTASRFVDAETFASGTVAHGAFIQWHGGEWFARDRVLPPALLTVQSSASS